MPGPPGPPGQVVMVPSDSSGDEFSGSSGHVSTFIKIQLVKKSL